ncbi:MAG: DUF1905 domain-containing protein [Lachnospiraceae bacterium]|nr:DUF1905 domain-containing protein [Lachnospiraceae bacterium]MDE6971540.1 DUF1905 domain-containing protein [Lachnospiraceae bacterium]
MRYFFDGKIEKQDDVYCIRIPFNVWEVCKLRDIIKAELVLDNRIIDCELLPETKGNYKIHLSDEDVSHTNIDQVHKILLHITGSLIQMNQNSPYSFDNPIRKIDGIEIIIQPEDGLCGQTCVAMLAGVTIAEVISVMDCREWQGTMGRVISALNYYGIDHSDIIVYTEGKEATLPKCCIMMEKMGLYCHYLVHYNGKFYDSNLGIIQEYDMSKLLGYMEVKVD